MSSSEKQNLFAIYIIRHDPLPCLILASATEFSSFSFFTRGKVSEFASFTAQTIAERTTKGIRQSIDCNTAESASSSTPKPLEAVAHSYTTPTGLNCTLLATSTYPTRAAYSLIAKAIDSFCQNCTTISWQSSKKKISSLEIPLSQLLKQYQNPHEADTLLKLQKDLDETKIILHGTIESVLKRGEKLDELVQKSEELSVISKQFYKNTKKANQCCTYF